MKEYNLGTGTSTGKTNSTAVGTTSNVGVPNVPGITPFKDTPPNTDFLKNKVQWNSATSGKTIK
jgi:hypothetical protein